MRPGNAIWHIPRASKVLSLGVPTSKRFKLSHTPALSQACPTDVPGRRGTGKYLITMVLAGFPQHFFWNFENFLAQTTKWCQQMLYRCECELGPRDEKTRYSCLSFQFSKIVGFTAMPAKPVSYFITRATDATTYYLRDRL